MDVRRSALTGDTHVTAGERGGSRGNGHDGGGHDGNGHDGNGHDGGGHHGGGHHGGGHDGGVYYGNVYYGGGYYDGYYGGYYGGLYPYYHYNYLDYGYYDPYFYNNYAYVYPHEYYYRRPYESFYFFTDLGDYEDRFVPQAIVEYQTSTYAADEPVDTLSADDPLSAGYNHFVREEYYQSILEFSNAIEAQPDDGLIYFARAQAYFAIGDYHSAYEDLISGMQIVPDWPDVRLNLKEIYNDLDTFEEHLEAIEAWADDHPDDVQGMFVLGYTYFFLQRYDLAKNELIHVLSRSKRHPQAKRLLDEIYEREIEKPTADENKAYIQAPPEQTGTAKPETKTGGEAPKTGAEAIPTIPSPSASRPTGDPAQGSAEADPVVKVNVTKETRTEEDEKTEPATKPKTENEPI